MKHLQTKTVPLRMNIGCTRCEKSDLEALVKSLGRGFGLRVFDVFAEGSMRYGLSLEAKTRKPETSIYFKVPPFSQEISVQWNFKDRKPHASISRAAKSFEASRHSEARFEVVYAKYGLWDVGVTVCYDGNYENWYNKANTGLVVISAENSNIEYNYSASIPLALLRPMGLSRPDYLTMVDAVWQAYEDVLQKQCFLEGGSFLNIKSEISNLAEKPVANTNVGFRLHDINTKENRNRLLAEMLRLAEKFAGQVRRNIAQKKLEQHYLVPIISPLNV